ncbi:MAG: 3D domain-containing protein [Patescibacteria group bacterium]|nr:3D domain-containing protein [Patescibacteria group bacterium]MCL5224394.1 3D domain-containing protein [Patescibacteria group bacterium]
MSKRLVLMAFLALIGTTKIGVIQGASDPPAVQPEYQSALLAGDVKVTYQEVRATAYASVPEETSDHPFITASGAHVHDGTIAANWLPFGTKVKLPAIFGDKVFTVEDHMNRKYDNGCVDVWMPSVTKAVDFGVKYTDIEIL